MNPEAQNRIGATKVVKTAINLIINNKSKAVGVVEKVGGKKAAKAFNKAYSPCSWFIKISSSYFRSELKKGYILAILII
ncbi:hypothetical protein MUA19_07845 [Staphylococcus chromogenes]|uniref:hypothetical protein n=1 Tax=Staphylococcus chromogenes TaxID=46126 RepID=UPI0021CFC964|nr:hypothetical protein [Staphylococcus chromogenes]UXS67189.1 hypothetical protein MUA19_07845 [Staphylococcus chromogenes]